MQGIANILHRETLALIVGGLFRHAKLEPGVHRALVEIVAHE